MVSRRDWLLQQLGITQWMLRHPAVLQGEIAVSLTADIRLVIIAEMLPALDDPFVADVLRALMLGTHQVMSLTPEQALMLSAKSRCHSWLMGAEMPHVLSGVQLITPTLNGLYQSASARKALWQQICENEHDFFPEEQ